MRHRPCLSYGSRRKENVDRKIPGQRNAFTAPAAFTEKDLGVREPMYFKSVLIVGQLQNQNFKKRSFAPNRSKYICIVILFF